MKKLFTILICLFLFYGLSNAQNIERSIVSVQGESSSNESFIINWTLGDNFIETSHFNDKIITQGFLQPINTIFETPKVEYRKTTQVVIAPNPVHSKLSIILPPHIEGDAYFKLYDVSGRLINSEKVGSVANQHQMEFINYPFGIYFLHILTEDGSYSESFKIIRK